MSPTSSTAPGPDGGWTCPMHPQVRQERPGACPVCGMALAPPARSGRLGGEFNDAPTPAVDEVGIAMGTGADVALESAGVTLLEGAITGILRARRLSWPAMRNIRQNLFFAFVFNVIAIPVAGGALYPLWGLLLNPVIAAAAMSFSSVTVISNALRLRRVTL